DVSPLSAVGAWRFTEAGDPLWRTLIQPEPPNNGGGTPTGAVAGAGGDVILSTAFYEDGRVRPVVVRVAAADGHEVWRNVIDAEGRLGTTQGIVVGEDGDPLVAGDIVDTTDADSTILLKLDFTTGAELWRHTVAPPSQPVGIIAIGLDVVFGMRA